VFRVERLQQGERFVALTAKRPNGFAIDLEDCRLRACQSGRHDALTPNDRDVQCKMLPTEL